MARLVTSDGVSYFELAEGEDNLVGRDDRGPEDPPKFVVGSLNGGATVSRRHARVFLRDGRWFLRVEPTSTNPTRVGEQVIARGEETPLSDQARLQLGDLVLLFQAPMPVSTPARDDRREADVTIGPEPTPVPAATAPPPPPPTIPTPVLTGAGPATTPVVRPPSATWPARLPDRPETLTAIGVGEFKRVNPFRGLMIDEAAWADAHDYHRILARLHLLAGHGWGVVEGLEVVAEEQIGNAIAIRPGIAIDETGRAIIVSQTRRLDVRYADGTTIYVVARLREEPAMPQRFWNDLDEYTRIIEKCETQVQTSPPRAPDLELARVTVTGPVRNATDPRDPRPGEIDLRFRERLLVRPRPDLGVAQLLGDAVAASGPNNHPLGLRFLLREIAQTTSYRPRWGGTVPPGEKIPPVSFLYLSSDHGFAASPALVEQLRSFLNGGGVLFADGCAAGGDVVGFQTVVEELARRLERPLQPVERWHPLLSARHVFAKAPLPVSSGVALSEADGLILTTADYGCAWTGGREDAGLPRETIRAALELGVNAAVYARQRQRPLDQVELEG